VASLNGILAWRRAARRLVARQQRGMDIANAPWQHIKRDDISAPHRAQRIAARTRVASRRIKNIIALRRVMAAAANGGKSAAAPRRHRGRNPWRLSVAAKINQ